MIEQAGSRSPHFRSDALAKTYADIMLPRIFQPWGEVLLKVVSPRPGEGALDVATGPGTIAWMVAKLVGPNGRVTGVDNSAAMLSVARSRQVLPGMAVIEYIEASAHDMPVASAAYDLVTCQQGLQHMRDPEDAIREMRRALKPGGRLGVAAWTESPFASFRRAVAAFSNDLHQPSALGRDREELRQQLVEAGFRDVTVATHELTVTFEGGVAQAMQIAEATALAPALAALSSKEQRAVRRQLARELEARLDGGSVKLPTGANIAVAFA